MPQTTITVQAKQSPAIGKKQGKLQDTEGNMWNVWGDKIQNYREGATYDITYEEQEFNDRKYNLISKGNPSNHKPSTGALPQDGWPGPAPSGYRPQPNDASRGTPPSSGTAAIQYIDPKAETIFVCGVINNAMSNANINPFEITLTELIAMVDKARSAWRNTLGKSQRDHEMQDEIPH